MYTVLPTLTINSAFLYDSATKLLIADPAIVSEPAVNVELELNVPVEFFTRILVVEALTIVAEYPPLCVTEASAAKPPPIVGLPVSKM